MHRTIIAHHAAHQRTGSARISTHQPTVHQRASARISAHQPAAFQCTVRAVQIKARSKSARDHRARTAPATSRDLLRPRCTALYALYRAHRAAHRASARVSAACQHLPSVPSVQVRPVRARLPSAAVGRSAGSAGSISNKPTNLNE